MTYAQNGLIQATDYNTLVGVSPSSTANTLNTVWAVGASTAGYGQTALAQVSAGDTITAAQWANLINTTANTGSHQGTSLTSISAPVAGGTVTYLSALPTNVQAIYTGRNNASAQGSTIANTATYGSTWSSALTFTHTVTFASGDAARYFFNAGGQIKITMSHPAGSGINALFNSLATACGTIVQSAPTSGTVTIASTSYNGISKIGGSGTATLGTNTGYYALTTANAQVFSQTATTGPAGYLSTFISVNVKSNGTQGSNGDTGSVITIYTLWDEVPNGLTVSTGSAVTVTLAPPATTYLPQGASWGTPTVSGTVTGS
jgi:hypothetical protein